MFKNEKSGKFFSNSSVLVSVVLFNDIESLDSDVLENDSFG